ncbi:MAG TPA: hypothetical protein PK239_03785 [Chitinophagales bacterium]|nr:hypothetical protein [Chitinophagales bacterium]
MTFRIQKTIISRYLDLVDQDQTSEKQIIELLTTIDNLYKSRVLTSSDSYRQKLELIISNLDSALVTLKPKRTYKVLKMELSKDLYKILKSDIEGVDYSNTNLADLHKFDNDKEIIINLDNVKATLENLLVIKRRLNSEVDFEKFVTDQLAMVFGKERVHRQFNIGGFLALKTDIDIGNGQVGIELKIADNLSATDMQRMIGQVIYYKKRFYNNNLLLFIASKSSITPTTKELKDFIEELGTTVIFTSAINL